MDTDIKTIEDAGFDKYLSRTSYWSAEETIGNESRYMSVRNLSGGNLGKIVIKLGDNLLTLDGKNGRILIGDGTTNRILIGKQSGGF